MVENTARSIIVFGATGKSGQATVAAALERGFAVRAFVRDTARMPAQDRALDVRIGDIRDPASIEAALDGRLDAAVSLLGVFSRKPSTVLSDGTRAITTALRERGVRRLIVVSSLGVGDSAGQGNWAARAWQRFVIPRILEDKERQEAAIAASGLDWTILRPCRLMEGPEVRTDLVEWSGPPPDRPVNWRITRATLAHRILDALDDPTTIGRAINLSEPG